MIIVRELRERLLPPRGEAKVLLDGPDLASIDDRLGRYRRQSMVARLDRSVALMHLRTAVLLPMRYVE